MELLGNVSEGFIRFLFPIGSKAELRCKGEMFMYIRCQHCGKILAEWVGPNCIEIRNGKRRAVITMSRAEIDCDRCGTRNIIASQGRGSAIKQPQKQVLRGDIA